MLMIGVMTYGISSGWFDDVPKNAEEYTYTVGGSPQVGYLYHDTLPLYVQDLTDTDYARYSCEALERGDSVFVRQVEYRQELPTTCAGATRMTRRCRSCSTPSST